MPEDRCIMPENQYEHDVFFSYSSKNQAVVDPVVADLKARAVNVTAYKHEPSDTIIGPINDAMTNSRDWVLWVSQDSHQSGYCKLERMASLHLWASQTPDSERRLWMVLLDKTSAGRVEPLFQDFQKYY